MTDPGAGNNILLNKKAKQCWLSKTDSQLQNEKGGRQKLVSTFFFPRVSEIWGEN
jgi:hypothetical protein